MTPLLWLGWGAASASQDVTFCVRAMTEWIDGDREGGDYWDTNDLRKLRGLWVKVSNDDTFGVPFEGYTDVNGCTPALTLYSAFHYTVSAVSKSQIDGLGVEARYCPANNQATCEASLGQWSLKTYVLETGYHPTGTTPITRYEDGITWDAEVGWLSVASRVLWLTSWNIDTSLPLQFYEKAWGGGCGLQRQGGPLPFAPGSDYCSTFNAEGRPWDIAHETGHVAAQRREHGEDANGGCDGGCDACELTGQIDLDAPTDSCLGESQPTNSALAKGQFSKEFQATSAREGWADFVAAVTFNDASEDDCVFNRIQGADVDLDNNPGGAGKFLDDATDDENNVNHNPVPDDIADPGSMFLVSCDDEPLTSALCSAWTSTYGMTACEDTSMAFSSGRDWLEAAVAANDPVGCTGTLTNRSTEFDWLRFWWDLRTTQGIPLSKLVVLADAMNQRDWDPNDNGSSPGLSSTSDDVTVRLTAAAAATTCFDPSDPCTSYVNAERSNGQDH